MTDIDMLTLDHINNNGGVDARHAVSRSRTNTSTGMYTKARKQGFPDGLQTLCANHQLKKETLRARAHLKTVVKQPQPYAVPPAKTVKENE